MIKQLTKKQKKEMLFNAVTIAEEQWILPPPCPMWMLGNTL